MEQAKQVIQRMNGKELLKKEYKIKQKSAKWDYNGISCKTMKRNLENSVAVFSMFLKLISSIGCKTPYIST